MNENSFIMIKIIGKGRCSKVYLCRHKKNKKFYAVKILSKIDLIRQDMIDVYEKEKKIKK